MKKKRFFFSSPFWIVVKRLVFHAQLITGFAYLVLLSARDRLRNLDFRGRIIAKEAASSGSFQNKLYGSPLNQIVSSIQNPMDDDFFPKRVTFTFWKFGEL